MKRILLFALLIVTFACSDDRQAFNTDGAAVVFKGDFGSSVAKVTSTAFERGDQLGVYARREPAVIRRRQPH